MLVPELLPLPIEPELGLFGAVLGDVVLEPELPPIEPDVLPLLPDEPDELDEPLVPPLLELEPDLLKCASHSEREI